MSVIDLGYKSAISPTTANLIAAFGGIEADRARTILDQSKWLANEALLRGDIQRYTGITGVTPQVYNPDYAPNRKAAIQRAGEEFDSQVLNRGIMDLIGEKANKGNVFYRNLMKDPSKIGSFLSNPANKWAVNSLTKEVKDKYDQLQSTDEGKKQIQGLLNERQQYIDSRAEQFDKENPEYFTGRDFGKYFQKMFTSYQRDSKILPQDQLVTKYARIFGDLATTYARPDDYRTMLFKGSGGGGGGDNEFTFTTDKDNRPTRLTGKRILLRADASPAEIKAYVKRVYGYEPTDIEIEKSGRIKSGAGTGLSPYNPDRENTSSAAIQTDLKNGVPVEDLVKIYGARAVRDATASLPETYRNMVMDKLAEIADFFRGDSSSGSTGIKFNLGKRK